MDTYMYGNITVVNKWQTSGRLSYPLFQRYLYCYFRQYSNHSTKQTVKTYFSYAWMPGFLPSLMKTERQLLDDGYSFLISLLKAEQQLLDGLIPFRNDPSKLLRHSWLTAERRKISDIENMQRPLHVAQVPQNDAEQMVTDLLWSACFSFPLKHRKDTFFISRTSGHISPSSERRGESCEGY